MSLCSMPLAEYCYAKCCYADCHHAECHYAEYHYAERHYPECRGAFSVGFEMTSPFLSLPFLIELLIPWACLIKFLTVVINTVL